METDERCKFPRISNGNGKLGHGQKMDEQFPDEEEDGDNKRGEAEVACGSLLGGGLGRYYGWPSSRIVRVSRASGGKDRHSKVLTSKGLRDRRVRLSVNTAIQFYDLQDRLGYDQPSKAVEWLLKAAAASIDELPSMSNPFPDIPKKLSGEKRSSTAGSGQLGFDSAKVDVDAGVVGDPNFPQPQMTKSSACSSTSETSKGSGGLSLSRSESRIKARERAKGRVAEKKENEPSLAAGGLNHISETTSFTELLSGGINNVSNHTGISGEGTNTNGLSFFLKTPRNWPSTPMDYFTSGLLGPPGQMHLSGASQFTPVASQLFNVAEDHHPELQHFSFVSDLVPVATAAACVDGNDGGGDYNLNFSISPSSGNSSGVLAGFNRGTLQSNSSPPLSVLPQLQRLSGGSPQGFYLENHHHQFQSGYDARLQLCYGDSHGNENNSGRNAGQKGKGKN